MGRFKPASFPQVMEKGRSRSNRYLVLYYLPEPEDEVRLAISVPRKSAKAVARNRVRRRVREVFRAAVGNLRAAGQFAFIVRRNAVSASYRELEWAVKDVLRKMDLWNGDGGA